MSVASSRRLYFTRKKNTGGINFAAPIISMLPRDSLSGRRVLIWYRYISWFLTSLFYLAGEPGTTVLYKLGVVIALLLAGRLAVHLYEQSKQTSVNLLLLAVETLGIVLLLIPTGGLNSPFMWYALNPIFLAASLLPRLYCWGILGIFLAAASASSIYFHGYVEHPGGLWKDNAWQLLVFLLLTSAAQMFAHLINKLAKAYSELAGAHQMSEQYLAHITDLYQALESFASGENPRHLADLLALYTRKLTRSPAAVCWLSRQDESGDPLWVVADPEGVLPEEVLPGSLEMLGQRALDEGKGVFIVTVPSGMGSEDEQIKCVLIESQSEFFGVLGCLALPGNSAAASETRAMSFLAELGAIVLERCKTEAMATRLQVAEEQNRIANEIHDGVSQHLFSIVYALHALSKKQAGLQDEEVQQQLALIRRTASKAAQDLRISIYGISPHKRGESIFISGLASYLDGLARLNGVKTDLQAEGIEDSLSPALRKALYRIIQESAGNALRHGDCSALTVRLYMSPGRTLLEVEDNGCGFIPAAAGSPDSCPGLGVRNMTQLAECFNGELELQSKFGQGTVVRCFIPRRNEAGVSPRGAFSGEACGNR